MRAKKAAASCDDGHSVRPLPLSHLMQILDEVRDVAVVVGKDRELRYCNRSAAEFLERGDPLCLGRGRLLCPSESADLRLGRTIDSVCSNGDSHAVSLVLRDEDDVPAVVTIRCLDLKGVGCILVLAADPRPNLTRVIEPLRNCFRLTRAEALVAIAIAEGSSLPQIAERRSVSVATIRTQLKTVAAKLGCTRQSQIAAIVHAVPWSALDR